jgi:hypothetical protein
MIFRKLKGQKIKISNHPVSAIKISNHPVSSIKISNHPVSAIKISNHPVSAKKRKTKRFKNFVFSGGGGLLIFRFSRVSWDLTPAKSEGREHFYLPVTLWSVVHLAIKRDSLRENVINIK